MGADKILAMGADWTTVIPTIEPLCFQVLAGDSLGTAFAIGLSRADGGRHTMLATALHVVQGVLGNDKPIELVRSDGSIISQQSAGTLRIFPVGNPECDTAAY